MSTKKKTYPNTETLIKAIWCVFNDSYGLTYQLCRFCKQGREAHYGLFKYAVRHYICTECRGKAFDEEATTK